MWFHEIVLIMFINYMILLLQIAHWFKIIHLNINLTFTCIHKYCFSSWAHLLLYHICFQYYISTMLLHFSFHYNILPLIWWYGYINTILIQMFIIYIKFFFFITKWKANVLQLLLSFLFFFHINTYIYLLFNLTKINVHSS